MGHPPKEVAVSVGTEATGTASVAVAGTTVVGTGTAVSTAVSYGHVPSLSLAEIKAPIVTKTVILAKDLPKFRAVVAFGTKWFGYATLIKLGIDTAAFGGSLLGCLSAQ